MNWLQKIASMTFLDTCVDCLEDPAFNEHTGIYDATELAGVVEGGSEISGMEFSQLCQDGRVRKAATDPDRYHFFVNSDRGIAWIYDFNDDVHYFYG